MRGPALTAGAAASLCVTWSGPARAGACCTGSTSTTPTRLGECEHVMAALGFGIRSTPARWDGEGRVQGSSMVDDSVSTTVAAAWRLDRKGQIAATLPVMLNHKAAGSLDTWGGGAGDLSVSTLWDPLTEWVAGSGHAPLPVPILTAGLRLPTGRSWTEADGTLAEDVTGRPGVGALLSLSVERTLDRTPWSLGVSTELAASDSDIRPSVTASGSVGRYLGRKWSASLHARHQRDLSTATADLATRTSAGLVLTTARPLKWRAWAGVDGDLPLPGLGQGSNIEVSGSVGYALIR